MFWVKDMRLQKRWVREYREIMSRSRFSLCPRGYSPNSFRLTESLRAGAIPVVIADDIRLPKGYDWSSCLVRVREADVGRLDKIIRRIPREREDKMREACLKLGRMLEEDPAYFIRYYLENEA